MAFLSNARSDCRPLPAARVSLLDLLALSRQRHDLAKLDGEALKDIGLTREQAHAESRRGFWDVPAK